MSRHWDPTDELVRVRETRPKPAWPRGATAGLVLFGLGCVGVAMLLYRVAGPRDIVGP